MNTVETERTVDLRILFFRILKRWRLLLLILLLGLLAGAAFKYIRGSKTAVTSSNDSHISNAKDAAAVRNYEIQKADCERALQDAHAVLDNYYVYLQDSPLSEMDPYNVPYANARLVISAVASDESSAAAPTVVNNGIRYILYTISGRLESAELYQRLSDLTGKEDRHLRELIFFTPNASNGNLEIGVNYTSLEMAERILDEILDYADLVSKDIEQDGIASYKVEAFKGFSGMTVSSTINNLKTNQSKNLATLKTNLSNAETALSSLPSSGVYYKSPAKVKELLKYALLFGAAFFLLGIVLVALKLLFPHKILSAGDAERSFALPVFGDYGSLNAKHNTRFDKWIRRHLEGKTFNLDTDGHSEVIRVASEASLENVETLYLLSTGKDEALEKITESLRKSLSGLKIETLKGVLEDPAVFEKLKEGSAALIVEKLEKTAYSAVVSEPNYGGSRDAEVKGCILYE